MSKRLELQALLEQILGSRNVYFQPPENVKILYPAIIFSRSGRDTIFANNQPYSSHIQYSITVIDKDPDSYIPDKIALLPTCKFQRHYKADNLNHDVFNLYY